MIKRLMSVLLVIPMCFSNIMLPVRAVDTNESIQIQSVTSTLSGDVDGNGIINDDDLILLSKHVARITEITDEELLLNADVNSDDEINAEDITALSDMFHLDSNFRIAETTVNNDTAVVGSNFEWTAYALGGEGQVEYSFELRKMDDIAAYNMDSTDSIVASQTYSTEERFNVTISEAGIYAVTVHCMDENGTICSLNDILPVTVTNTAFDAITIKSDKGKYVCENNSIEWCVETVGGNAPFTYEYTLYCNSRKIDKIQSNNPIYYLESCSEGEYQLFVECTDVDGLCQIEYSDVINVYTEAECYPDAPVVWVEGDVIKLADTLSEAQKAEVQGITLLWNAVTDANEYGLELSYHTAGQWASVHIADSIKNTRYTLPYSILKTSMVEKLYRIGIYSKGVMEGKVRYYYFYMTPTTVDTTLTVDDGQVTAWDIATANRVARHFEVSSELDYTVTSNVEWITCVKETDGFITTVAENSDHVKTRTGNITVDNGENTVIIQVNQGNGQGAPILLYPYLSSDANAPTERPVGGITLEFEEDYANYVGVRIYELSASGERTVVYENIVDSDTGFLHIIEPNIGGSFTTGKQYMIELGGRYSTSYAENEVEHDVEKAIFYMEMVPDGHEILVNGTDYIEVTECARTKIKLYATNTWTYTLDVDWIHVENHVYYWKDIEEIKIEFEPNYTQNTRSGEITFHCGNKSAVVKVTQNSWLPRFVYPEVSQNMSNPTILPSCGLMMATVYDTATYAIYENGVWGDENNFGSLSAAATDYTLIPDDYFETDALYRFTMHTGEYTSIYYAKFSASSTQNYVVFRDGVDEVKNVKWRVSSGETEHEIKMKANASWTITSDSSWLTSSSTSGSARTSWKTLTITSEANTTGKERTGVLSFKIGSTVYATLSVTQPATDYLELFVNDKEDTSDYIHYNSEISCKMCDGSGDHIRLHAWSNDYWGAVSNTSWITVNDGASVEGKDSGSYIEIDLEENTGSSIRTGTVTVYSGKVSQTVTITQVPGMKAPTLVSPLLSTSYESPSSVIYNDIDLTWNAVKGATYYEVKVNPEDVAVLLPNSYFYSYINRIDSTGKDTYSCTIPKTAFSLNADSYDYIVVYAYDEYGYSVKNRYYLISSLGDVARINGTMTPTWDNATDIEVSKEFIVNSTSDWTAVSKANWISIDRTSGTNGDALTVSLTKNTGNARTGQVVITVGSTETILTVNQCAYLPEFPSITSPDFSDDEGNPTIIPENTTSITVTWNSAPQAENYQIKLLSYSTTSAGHVEQRSGLLDDGEESYTFTDLSLVSGQLYMIFISRQSHWGNTARRYYFTVAQQDAWVQPEHTDIEFPSEEDYGIVDITSSGVWTASTDTAWIMLENEHITQEFLDEYGDLSSYYHSYSGVSGECLYISVLANPDNTYRYGTVTVKSGGAEATIEIAQEPYYEIAEIYSPALADKRQDSVGLPYGNVTVRWNACIGGAGTYQIILEEREEDSTYKYYDILEVTDITKTSYTIPVSKLKEGGYYRLKLCSDLVGVDTDESPCQSYYFYMKYENELTVSADVEWDTSNKMVKISASATGGAGGYLFAYELLCDGKQVDLTDLWDWDYYTFPLTETGVYQVRVYCRDNEGFSDELYSSSYDVNNTVADSVSLSQNRWNLSASGGNVTIVIQSNSTWVIESCPSWVSYSSADGKNGDSIILSVGANTSTERTGSVTFVSGAARTSLSVVQESAVLKSVITYPLSGISIDISDVPVKWKLIKEADSYLVSVRDITTDVLLVNQHPTTDAAYTISSTSLSNGHDYRIAIGTVVGGQTWWTESTFSITMPEISSGSVVEDESITHNYNRVTVGTSLINQNATYHDVVTTFYEECSICGDTTAQKTDTVTVVHNFTYTGYEATHPHAKFQRCSCGAAPYIDGAFKTANGQVQDKAACCICHGHSYDTVNPKEVNGQWRAYCSKCGNYKSVDVPASSSPVICTHPNGFNMKRIVTNAQSYTNVNEKHFHMAYNSSYTVYCCSQCGTADMSTKSSSLSNQREPHIFNSDAVCTSCGFVSVNGVYDYTERYVLSIGSKYYIEDGCVYTGVGQALTINVYDTYEGIYSRASNLADVSLSLKDSNGIARIENDTFIASNSGSCEIVLSYFGKQVDSVPIGVTVLSVEDEFFTYNILSSGVVRVDDLNNIDWKDGNALLTPWVAMGNYSAKQNSDASHTIAFDVYNSSAEILGFGVFDNAGNRINDNTELIKPHWETGSFVGEAWRTFSKTAQIWNMSKSFDGAGTETTQITLTVPEGGYIQLMDISEDMRVFSANIGEFILGSVKLADDVEGLINPADAKVMQELVYALGEDEFAAIIYNYLTRLYGSSVDDFIALYLKENGNKFVIESMVETLLKGGLMDEIINNVPETVLKTIIDKTEDGILILVPGLYLLKHGSQTLYDFGGMAQLSVAFDRCINDKNEKYISHIIVPYRDAKTIVVDYNKILDNTSRTVVTSKDTNLCAKPTSDFQAAYSVSKRTRLELIGSITNFDEGILYY